MLGELAHRVEHAANRTARTALLGFGASVTLIVGILFLTLAAWIYLVQVTSALSAALILGGMFVGVSLIMFSMLSARRRALARRRERDRAALKVTGMQELLLAFLSGMKAGRSRRRG